MSCLIMKLYPLLVFILLLFVLCRDNCKKDEINVEDKVDVFGTLIDNLSNSNKTIRVSTLRILSHFFARDEHLFANDKRPNKRLKTEESELAKESAKHTNVCSVFLYLSYPSYIVNWTYFRPAI